MDERMERAKRLLIQIDNMYSPMRDLSPQMIVKFDELIAIFKTMDEPDREHLIQHLDARSRDESRRFYGNAFFEYAGIMKRRGVEESSEEHLLTGLLTYILENRLLEESESFGSISRFCVAALEIGADDVALIERAMSYARVRIAERVRSYMQWDFDLKGPGLDGASDRKELSEIWAAIDSAQTLMKRGSSAQASPLDEIDRAISGALDAFTRLRPKDRELAIELMADGCSLALLAYALRMSEAAVRASSKAHVSHGLLALIVEDRKVDPGYSDACLGLLCHSASRIGANDVALVRLVIPYGRYPTGAAMLEYVQRPPAEKSIAVEAYRERLDTEGLRLTKAG